MDAAVELLRRAVERNVSASLSEVCEFTLRRVEQAIMDDIDSEYWSDHVLRELSEVQRRAL